MNSETITLERHLKKTAILTNAVSVIIALATALSVGYGFFYNTKATLNDHTTEIQKVEKEVIDIKTKINETDVFKGVYESELKQLQKKVDNMDEKLDRIIMQTR